MENCRKCHIGSYLRRPLEAPAKVPGNVAEAEGQMKGRRSYSFFAKLVEELMIKETPFETILCFPKCMNAAVNCCC